MSDNEATESLKELGLSTYEARVFIALVEIGSGTAREIASVTDVPRPQVYTTAHDLESRGFISIQQSNPQVFQPVSLDEAKAQLENRFETQRDSVFDYLESLESATGNEAEENEDVWSITGETAITERIAKLASEANQTILYGDPNLVDPSPDLVTTLEAACDRGIDVILLAQNDQTVDSSWVDNDNIKIFRSSQVNQSNKYAERMLIVDHDVFLLSIRGGKADEETAVWSARTTFAQIFCQLTIGNFEEITTETPIRSS
jgi:sugar-specific transcriptional regulator TrmB